jgi:hypothetical protein
MSESPKKRALESDEESEEEWVGPRFDENTTEQNEREEVQEKQPKEVHNKKLQIKKQKSRFRSKLNDYLIFLKFIINFFR